MRLVLLFVLVLLSGCAATVTVPPSAYADTSARLDGERVTVVLADGRTALATALRLGPDSTSWFDAARGTLRVVPSASVVRVEHRDRGRAVRRGVLRGVVGGAAIAVLTASIFCFDTADGPVPSCPSRSGYAVVAAGGVLLGVPAGALGGAIRNTPDRYVLASPDTLGRR